MNRREKSIIKLAMLSAVALLVFGACEKSSLDPEHGHMQNVEFSYTPATAVTGTAITFLFKVDEDGVHTSVTDAACELHGLGAVALTEGETGHYTGSHTFTQAGTFDVHFGFMHEGAHMEEAFSITVN